MVTQIDELFAEPDSTPQPTLTLPQLRILLHRQANLIVDTGTGGQGFKQADPQYKTDDAVLVANFSRLGLSEPFPWRSLWEWYAYYREKLPQWQDRRDDIADRVKAALALLSGLEGNAVVVDLGGDEDPSWEQLNGRIQGLIDEMASARDKDTWQDVGRRSREVLIDLGKLIASITLIFSDTVVPKGADARGWFDLFLTHYANGADRKELRSTMRATWDLAQKVTHGDIRRVDAFASAQATILLVRTAQMLITDTEGY